MSTIRRLTAADALIYRAVRERALEEHADAFLTSVAEQRARPIEETEKRLDGGTGAAVFGAFVGDQLIGISGLYPLPNEKLAHRAMLWGMYVATEHRGRGLGRDLLRAVVAHARTVDGVVAVGLSVNANNTRARELYVAEGFVPWGLERDASRSSGVSWNEEHLRLEL